jgi:hypothetical protein
MRRTLLLTIAGVALLVLTVVAVAPATLLAPWLASATHGALTLADTGGFWWNGYGTLSARNGARMAVAWRVDTGALVQGTVRARLTGTGDEAGPRGEIELRDGRVRLGDLALTVPARLVVGAFPSVSGRDRFDVGGDVSVSTAEFVWPPPAARGEATLRWDGARLALPDGGPVAALGSVTLRATAIGDRIAGPVTNVGGDVALAGSVDAAADGAVRGSVLATPRDGADPRLARLLAAAGTPEGAGVRIAFTVNVR